MPSSPPNLTHAMHFFLIFLPTNWWSFKEFKTSQPESQRKQLVSLLPYPFSVTSTGSQSTSGFTLRSYFSPTSLSLTLPLLICLNSFTPTHPPVLSDPRTNIFSRFLVLRPSIFISFHFVYFHFQQNKKSTWDCIVHSKTMKLNNIFVIGPQCTTGI